MTKRYELMLKKQELKFEKMRSELRFLVTIDKQIFMLYNYSDTINFYYGKSWIDHKFRFFVGEKPKGYGREEDLKIFDLYFKDNKKTKLRKAADLFKETIDRIITYNCYDCEEEGWSADIHFDDNNIGRCGCCDNDNGVYAEREEEE